MANNNTNSITAKIVDYRYIGKQQLNADDMGGIGCANWDNYLKVCRILATSAWDYTMGRAINDDVVATAVAGLLDFFGISYTDARKHTVRLLTAVVTRKPKRSDALKDALKAKKDAKKAWEDALSSEKSEAEIEALKAIYEDASKTVEKMYTEPHNYWFDPAPMFDAKTHNATPKARKNIEDTCADIFQERKFMSADEIKKEKQALDDERKGREIRKKKEAKAESASK